MRRTSVERRAVRVGSESDFGVVIPWRKQAIDGFEQGGFARTVAAGDEEDFAGHHVEAHVEEHLLLAVAGGEVSH